MYSVPIAVSSFRKRLLRWNQEQNNREMPWKGETDPYRIWLSEIILQQTRVDQGLAYYHAFIQQYPTINALAAAADQEVFRLWEGLGYYSRCRNLLATAREISFKRDGIFPDTYNGILLLKGVGPYTAAAISSFAFGLPYAVLDGNVFRVLARVFGIDQPTDSTVGKKEFALLAQQLLDPGAPSPYNQAMMDFGATICKPAAPLCTACPFQPDCVAFNSDRIAGLPVKTKKITIRNRYFHYLLLEYRGKLPVRERIGKDVWKGLNEFPMIEAAGMLEENDLLGKSLEQQWLNAGKYRLLEPGSISKQQLSHQLIHGYFLRIRVLRKPQLPEGFHWVAWNDLTDLPFPRLIRNYLDEGRNEQ